MASIRYLKDRKCWIIRWHVTVKHGANIGTVVKGSKTFTKKAIAELFQKEINKQEELWAAGINSTSETVASAVAKWKKHAEQYTDATRKLYLYAVDSFIKSLPKSVHNANQIKKIHLSDYLANLTVMYRTKNTQLGAIRSFTKSLANNYDIPNIGLQVPKFIEDPPNTRFLTDGEYKLIMDYTKGDNHDILLFIANTGLRVTEFCNLTWRDINSDMTSIMTLGKGRKQRAIPLNSTCQEILTRHKKRREINTNDYIFMSKSNGQLSRFGIRDRCVWIAKQLGIRNFGPHAFRHYFATTLIIKGVRVQLVSKLLGHSSVKITEETYIHILPDHLAGITEVLT